MPSEDEIKFAKSRFKIQDAVCTSFAIAELLLPLQLLEGGAHLDSMVGDIQPDTLSGQQLVQFRTYRPSKGGPPEKITVAIGHTGSNWTPIVTVTSTSSEPKQIIFGAEFDDALQKVLQVIAARIKLVA